MHETGDIWRAGSLQEVGISNLVPKKASQDVSERLAHSLCPQAIGCL